MKGRAIFGLFRTWGLQIHNSTTTLDGCAQNNDFSFDCGAFIVRSTMLSTRFACIVMILRQISDI